MSGPHLFIDGKNSAYRAVHANAASPNQDKQHSLVVMLRFMRTWLGKHSPSSVHVFWDAPRATLWRRDVMPEYKDRDSKAPTDQEAAKKRDVGDEMARVQAAAADLFAAMGIRQYSRSRQEADDLIYAACKVVYPEPVVIVSSDGDFAQIPWAMPNVALYEPRLNKFVDKTPYSPVVRKALEGDDTDCVGGYCGIGPVKSTAMAGCRRKLTEFLAKSGSDMFKRNLALVDLSLCPFVLANQVYVMRQMEAGAVFDPAAIIATIGKHKIVGLLQEHDKVVSPFKLLAGSVAA